MNMGQPDDMIQVFSEEEIGSVCSRAMPKGTLLSGRAGSPSSFSPCLQWLLTQQMLVKGSGSHQGRLCSSPPKDIRSSMETFLVVTAQGQDAASL